MRRASPPPDRHYSSHKRPSHFSCCSVILLTARYSVRRQGRRHRGLQAGEDRVNNWFVKLGVAVLLFASFCTPAIVEATESSPLAAPTAAITPDPDYFLYIPIHAANRGPLQILVTVHGMGGDGANFCQNLINRAEQNGWVIVAPTFQYQDYKNQDLVVQDDTRMLPRLRQIIDDLPAKTGLRYQDKVLLYGFSRGAQIVHRFTEFYPDKVLATALFSAGSYTMPATNMTVNGGAANMAFPFGVADIQKYTNTPFNAAQFRQVPFFIGVGGADTNPQDTPRAWDALQGFTRVSRAESFGKAINDMGGTATVTVYPNVGHDVTTDERGAAMTFLEQQAFFYRLLHSPPGQLVGTGIFVF